MKNKFQHKLTSAVILTSIIGIGKLFSGDIVFADEIKTLERRLDYLIKKKELDREINKFKVKLNKLKNEYSDVINSSTINPKFNKSKILSPESTNMVVDAIGPYKQDLSRLSSENGKIISSTKLDFSRNSGTVEYYRIIYKSDGLKIEGYAIIPKIKTGKTPVVIYNRGGNRAFGELNNRWLMWLSIISKQGYVILASQYREGGDSEGRDEFGGADLNDVLNMVTLAKSLPIVDGNRIGMLGFSRGGMMTYQAIKRGADVKTAVVIGGVTDLIQLADDRGGKMVEVLEELIGDDEEEWRNRSAYYWPHNIRIPLLIMHGDDDQRVDVSQAEKLAEKLEELDAEFKFEIFEGGDHSLRSHPERKNAMIQSWLDRHLRN